MRMEMLVVKLPKEFLLSQQLKTQLKALRTPSPFNTTNWKVYSSSQFPKSLSLGNLQVSLNTVDGSLSYQVSFFLSFIHLHQSFNIIVHHQSFNTTHSFSSPLFNHPFNSFFLLRKTCLVESTIKPMIKRTTRTMT